MAEEENSDYKIEIRKIMLSIIYKSTKIKNDDYLSGLIELQDLLSELEYGLDFRDLSQDLSLELENISIIIQGRNNNISPVEYYTQKNYDNMYEDILIWQENELAFLKSIQ